MKPDLQFSRRSLLRAAGSTLLVPTFLKQAFAQSVTTTSPNLIVMMHTNGTHQASFWPTGTAFTSTILGNMLTDPTVGPKTTLINGIYLNKQGNPGGDGHDWGWHGIYSGYDNIAISGGQGGGGASVDQLLIKQLQFGTPFPNIHCGVNAANYSLINAGRASWVCAQAGAQVPCEIDIYALYTKVFGSVTTSAIPMTMTPGTPTGTPTPAATQAATLRLQQRKSVLDTVAADLTALEGRLGPAERAKVDIHLQAVRDFENRLTNLATLNAGGGTGTTTGTGGVTITRPSSCSSVKPSMTGVPSTGQGNEANAPALFTLFMEFIANAIGCNMVKIITYQAGRGGEHFHFAWLNLPGMQPDFHNQIAHKDTGDATVASVMVGVAQYQAGLVFDLASKLATFPQGNGKTALDNSLIVYGNELATGPHGTAGYPIVFLGGAAGKLKQTGVYVNSGTQPSQRLGCTIMNIMGVPATGFGPVANCGVLQGLSLA
jgi:hypothetical protein